MTNAKTLLLDLLAVIPDGEKAAAFFAEDGVFEIPFLHAIQTFSALLACSDKSLQIV